MTEQEIERALKDIAEVRESLKSNLKIMRPIVMNRSFAVFALTFGLIIAAILAGLHFALLGCESRGIPPEQVKWVGATALFLTFIVSGLVKQRIIRKSLARQDRSLSILDLFRMKGFIDLYALLAYGTVILAGVLTLLCVRGTLGWWTVFPVCAVYFGFIIALLSIAYQVPEYRILSVISVTFGFAALALMERDELLWLAAYVFVFLASYGLLILLARGNGSSGE